MSMVRFLFWVLPFVVIPVVELYLLLQIGAWLGPTAAFLLILLTGVAGGWLARREGLGVLLSLRRDLQKGMPPGDRMMEAVMVLVGGLLLVTPGVLTDLVGFSLVVPFTRRLLAPRFLGWLSQAVNVQITEFGTTIGGPMPEEPRVRVREPLRPPRPAAEGKPFANKFDDLP